MDESRMLSISEMGRFLNRTLWHNQAALEHLDSLSAQALKVGVKVTNVENKLANSKAVDKMMVFVNSPNWASYVQYDPVAVLFSQALLSWVVANEIKFKYPMNNKDGLKTLVSELGGD